MRRSTTTSHQDGLPGTPQILEERIAESHIGPQTALLMHYGSRLTLTIPEACQALGIGETMLRQMLRTGQLPILKIGRRVLIPRQAVEQLVAEACTG
jgi:excisionase family DNA binding protein